MIKTISSIDIKQLPREMQEKLARTIRESAPESLEAAIETLATVNYEARVTIKAYWNSEAEGQYQPHYRATQEQHIEKLTEALQKNILAAVQELDRKRLDEMIEFQSTGKLKVEASDDNR